MSSHLCGINSNILLGIIVVVFLTTVYMLVSPIAENFTMQDKSNLILHEGSNKCLTNMGGNVMFTPCDLNTPTQRWVFPGDGTIKNNEQCLNLPYNNAIGDKQPLNVWPCNGNQSQQWTVAGNKIKYTMPITRAISALPGNTFPALSNCLNVPSGDENRGITVWPCQNYDNASMHFLTVPQV